MMELAQAYFQDRRQETRKCILSMRSETRIKIQVRQQGSRKLIRAAVLN